MRPSGADGSPCFRLGSVIWIVAVLSFASNDVFVIPAFAILIGSTWADKGQLPRLLSTRLPIWLGEISYSVYLIHVLVIETLNYGWTRIVVRLHIPLVIDRSVFLAAATVAILLLANLTYRYIEKPGRRWLVSRVTRRVAALGLTLRRNWPIAASTFPQPNLGSSMRPSGRAPIRCGAFRSNQASLTMPKDRA